jgi:hypothetical protein
MPSESTAIYRKRNSRPALPAVPSDRNERQSTAPSTRASTAPRHAREEASNGDDPSGLPSVNLDAAAPRRRVRRSHASHTPLDRLIFPISLAAVLVLTTLLLRWIF